MTTAGVPCPSNQTGAPSKRRTPQSCLLALRLVLLEIDVAEYGLSGAEADAVALVFRELDAVLVAPLRQVLNDVYPALVAGAGGAANAGLRQVCAPNDALRA